MDKDEQLVYADRIGRFYTRQFGFSPMAGRMLGYLAVCVPEKQSIVELAEALMASRSAIAGAIQMLEPFQLITRTRTAGQRSDSISINPAGVERKGFDATVYEEQAALFREGLTLLHGNGHDHRAAMLEEAAALAEFLAERMPALQQEWHIKRDALRRRKETGGESIQEETSHAKEEAEDGHLG
jgi:DNA-binding MarR family transcriptional regulator